MGTKLLGLEEMQTLKALGVNIVRDDSGVAYRVDRGHLYAAEYSSVLWEEDIAAFDLQDCLNILPKIIDFNGTTYHLIIYVSGGFMRYNNAMSGSLVTIINPDMLIASFEMVVWLAKNVPNTVN